jgi:hypothetical protein
MPSKTPAPPMLNEGGPQVLYLIEPQEVRADERSHHSGDVGNLRRVPRGDDDGRHGGHQGRHEGWHDDADSPDRPA